MLKKIFNKKAGITSLVLGLALSGMSPVTALAAEDEDIVNLRLMETTDIHSNVMNHDYFTGEQDDTIGLVNVASLNQAGG